ncbi:MAG: hypothetical protein KDD33_10530 [Bdellovibrionales bacterium]|nr:hypothetical protein [Bdellovibrionales bacterium]
MRTILVSILIGFAFTAQATELKDIKDILKNYESKDINQKCEVNLTEKGLFTLKTFPIFGSVIRESLSRQLDFASSPGTNTWLGEGSDYDGHVQVYFIKRPYELVVLANFESYELDKDLATFCHLPIKKN